MFPSSFRKDQVLPWLLATLYGSSIATASYGGEIDSVYALARKRPPTERANVNYPQQAVRDRNMQYREIRPAQTNTGTGDFRQDPLARPDSIDRASLLIPSLSGRGGTGGNVGYSIPDRTESGVAVYNTAAEVRILVDLEDSITKTYVYAQEVYFDAPSIWSDNVTIQVADDASLVPPHRVYRISFRNSYGKEDVFLIDKSEVEKIAISCPDRAIAVP